MPTIQYDRVAFGWDSRCFLGINYVNGGTQLLNTFWGHHALKLCKQAGKFIDPVIDNWGVHSETSRQFLARLPGRLNQSSAGIIILRGPTNDRQNNFTAWQTIDNMQQIVRIILEAGRKVLLVADNARGDETFSIMLLNAQQLSDMHAARRWTLAQDNGDTIRVVDPAPVFNRPNSPDGMTMPFVVSDGIHDSLFGALLIGRLVAPVLTQMLPGEEQAIANTANDNWSASNPYGCLNANPAVKVGDTPGTLGTGGAGTIAQGWVGANSATASGVTRTYSYVPGSNEYNGIQECVMTGSTTAGANPTCDIISQSGLHTKMVAGATYEAFAEIDIPAGAFYLQAVSLRVEIASPSTGARVICDGEYDTGPNVGFYFLVDDDNGLWRCPRFVAPAGLTACALKVVAHLTPGANSGVNVTARIRSCWIRRVEI